MKPHTPVHPIAWVVFAALLIFLCWICVLSTQRATLQLSDLTALTGQLDSTRVGYTISHGRSRYSQYYVQFYVHGAAAKPAFSAANKLEALAMQTRLKSGNAVTIYYAAEGKTAEEGRNFHIYQIQSGDNILYALSEAHWRDELWAWGSGIMAIGLAAMMRWAYVRDHK